MSVRHVKMTRAGDPRQLGKVSRFRVRRRQRTRPDHVRQHAHAERDVERVVLETRGGNVNLGVRVAPVQVVAHRRVVPPGARGQEPLGEVDPHTRLSSPRTRFSGLSACKPSAHPTSKTRPRTAGGRPQIARTNASVASARGTRGDRPRVVGLPHGLRVEGQAESPSMGTDIANPREARGRARGVDEAMSFRSPREERKVREDRARSRVSVDARAFRRRCVAPSYLLRYLRGRSLPVTQYPSLSFKLVRLSPDWPEAP